MAEGEVVEVIVFDLNGTFYNKSSKDEFYKFICTKRPVRIKYYIEMFRYKWLMKLNFINQTEFKENFFNYLDNLRPAEVEKYAQEFWQREYPEQFNKKLLQHFTLMKSRGVKLFCATGALELYVKPLFDMFKIDGLAGTKVEYKNGTYKVIGEACKGQEKINRIKSHFGGKPYRLIEAYSDSKEHILDEAEIAYLIKNGSLCDYRKEKKSGG